MLDRVSAVIDRVFDAKGAAVAGVPTEEVECVLGDVKAQEQFVS